LVSYGEESVWEREFRELVPNHMVGISRFEFVEGPPNIVDVNPKSSVSIVINESFDFLKSPGVSWKQQYYNLVVHVPSKLMLTLDLHTDECLQCAFSNNGRYLAACSRDATMSVTEITPNPDEWKVLRIHTMYESHAVKASWSSDDSQLLLNTMMCSEIFSSLLNFQRIYCIRVAPFDFHSQLIGSNQLLVSEGISYSHNDGRYCQNFRFFDNILETDIAKTIQVKFTARNTAHFSDVLMLSANSDYEGILDSFDFV